ncbi:tyrosine-protein phosphatase [Sphingobium sp. CR2-8]|uniref:tyrosine-protein phosphatase n=1 Tax=Sphingobium sp. CR2-8 TaxID=1306534 RepID=UPI002DBE1127|nr:tyrosine-protein phosphatase [Sphingobium sp. CR2-8]MEC3912529.1 tyrosine-protein phosphatase [Sphingobium sp. CR2-8]
MTAITLDRTTWPLDSAFNLRDFGGQVTTDGRRVRRGVLYRSGTMALLSEDAAAHMRSLGIRAICDFRREKERVAEPTSWHGADTAYICRDYEETSGILSALIHSPAVTAAEMRDAIIAVYRTIAANHAESYRMMFAQIIAGRVPILINCAAGKDRTGVGAMLILAAIGVPHASIVEDYLLTNSQADWDRLLARDDSPLARARRDMGDAIAPLLRADTAYLDSLMAELNASYGGIEGYLEQALGVDASARAVLREALLES